MATPPRLTTLKETDLQIKDGAVQGLGLRDAFRRLFSSLNPYFDGLNSLVARGISFGSNFRCDIISGKFSHGVAQVVTLHTLTRAAGVFGWANGQIIIGSIVQPAQQTSGLNQVKVTLWFNDATAASVSCTLILVEDGQQSASTPTFLEAIAKSLLTTKGDMIYASAAAAPARLAAPGDGSYLARFTSGVPSWLVPPYCAAEYNTVAGQSIPSGGSTVINYDSKVKDTDNAVTTGAAWKFTCPTGKGGDYLVTANANYVLSPGTNPALLLFKNGVQAADLFNPIGGAAFGATTGIAGAAVTTLAAGDTLSVLTFQNSGGGRALSANAYQNRITINRLFGS